MVAQLLSSVITSQTENNSWQWVNYKSNKSPKPSAHHFVWYNQNLNFICGWFVLIGLPKIREPCDWSITLPGKHSIGQLLKANTLRYEKQISNRYNYFGECVCVQLAFGVTVSGLQKGWLACELVMFFLFVKWWLGGCGEVKLSASGLTSRLFSKAELGHA